MKAVKPGTNKPRNLKRDYKDLVMEAWDRLYPEDKQAERQQKRDRKWQAADVNRKAKEQL